jgi:hypothetical protein
MCTLELIALLAWQQPVSEFGSMIYTPQKKFSLALVSPLALACKHLKGEWTSWQSPKDLKGKLKVPYKSVDPRILDCKHAVQFTSTTMQLQATWRNNSQQLLQ